ncbi:AAA family ATPase [Streptomyces sp. NPDC047821]|uniref:helix-turn-helix transcriptional regulator n=1 Tax=Streptomyces sp. NPDC047821 TaxID=3365488 RepID=UPI003717D999
MENEVTAGAAASPAGPAAGLTGREDVCAAIRAALEHVHVSGSALLLRGDPGMGRSALLDRAEELAGRTGARVLRMTGVETEAELPYAALHQVLWPLAGHARGLPPRRWALLERALGIRSGPPPRPAAVSAALGTVLARVAAHRPLVLLLDDLHWADPASAAVFREARRWTATLPVVVIGTTRQESAGRWPGQVVELRPLDDDRAEHLLRTLRPDLADSVRRRVLRVAGGNPLALREIPAALQRAAPDQPGVLASLESTGPLGELPLGERIGRLYEHPIRALPEHARRTLLLAALAAPDGLGDSEPAAAVARDGALSWREVGDAVVRDGVLSWREVGDAVVRDGVLSWREVGEAVARDGALSWREVGEAVARSGLARVDPRTGRVVFRHPLVRAGLVHLASASERRAAHRLIADALPAGTRRTLHLAAATLGPDDELAALLDAEADRLTARADEAGAATVTARAAGLTQDGPARAARLARAAGLAARGGRLRFAERLLAEAEGAAGPAGPQPAALHALVAAYIRFHREGSPAPGVELLPRALELLTEPEGTGRYEVLREPVLFLLTVLGLYTGDERAWAGVGRHAGDPSAPVALCRRAWEAAPGDPDELPALIRAATGAPAPGPSTGPCGGGTSPDPGGEPGADPAVLRSLVLAAEAVDTVGEHDALWTRLAPRQPYGTRVLIDLARAHDGFLRGHWDDALALARRGARTAAAQGYVFNERMFLHHAAEILAGRGDRAGLRDLLAVLEPWAEDRDLRTVTAHLRGLKGLCALAHGAAGEAWQHLGTLTPAAAPPWDRRRTPWAHLTLLDAVQAASDSGHRDEAHAHLRAARAAGLARVAPHHAFLVAAAEALAATDDVADSRYEAAYAVPGAGQWVFELARLRLAHGAWLRRRSRRREAAERLRAAHAGFTRLGAGPWAAQAALELDAAGAGVPEHRPGGHPALTVQELRIAELAARGLTNKEIGAVLRLSPRTIGAHLYRIFPKLGVTTRAAVARALAGTGRPDEAGRRPGADGDSG